MSTDREQKLQRLRIRLQDTRADIFKANTRLRLLNEQRSEIEEEIAKVQAGPDNG